MESETDLHGNFVTRLTSRYRARAEELAWRRAANRGRSTRAWAWIVLGAELVERLVGAVFVILIIVAGYSLVQTQQHLETSQGELETAKQAADKARAQAAELAKRAVSLNSALEKATAQRNELQTKLDQATSEMKSTLSQLENKQFRIGGMQSELEKAKQAADQAKAQAKELAKRAASLNSELEKANAQRIELQAKLDQARLELTSAQTQLRDRQSRLVGMQASLRKPSRRQISQKRRLRDSRNGPPVSTPSSRKQTLNALSFRPNWIRPGWRSLQPNLSSSLRTPSGRQISQKRRLRDPRNGPPISTPSSRKQMLRAMLSTPEIRAAKVISPPLILRSGTSSWRKVTLRMR